MKSYVEIGIDRRMHVPVIDYLKGFSIFTIVLMHLMQMMTAVSSKIITLSSIGGTGVHVFFLCSGIGLYLSYLNHKTSFADFMKKRFLKIYVPYIIVVSVSYLFPWLYKGDNKEIALLSHIFLFKMFVPEYEHSFGIQFWFVSTIIQLYFLFIPMCLLKQKIRNKKIFTAVFLLTSVIWWMFCYLLEVSDERVWNSFCLQYVWEFALGFVIAEMLYEGRKIKIKNYILAITSVTGIGLQAVMAISYDSLKLFNDIPALIGYTSLALLLTNIPVIRYCANKLSTFSYEYFLVHMMVFTTIFYLINPQGIVLQCFIGAVSMIAAVVTAYIYKNVNFLIQLAL